jgi:hypothetical protein
VKSERLFFAPYGVRWRIQHIEGGACQGRQDQDFNVSGSPVIDHPNVAVADPSAIYKLHRQHAV